MVQFWVNPSSNSYHSSDRNFKKISYIPISRLWTVFTTWVCTAWRWCPTTTCPRRRWAGSTSARPRRSSSRGGECADQWERGLRSRDPVLTCDWLQPAPGERADVPPHLRHQPAQAQGGPQRRRASLRHRGQPRTGRERSVMK